jgi:hypothetical protein
MINGYPDNASIDPGKTIHFHVSTTAPKFQIELYRQGAALSLVTTIGPHAGVFAADHAYDQDWGTTAVSNGVKAAGWPAYSYKVPADFASGVYIAMLIELDKDGGTTPLSVLNTGTSYTPTAKLLFVVKNANPGYDSQMLYKLPYFTYQAYNFCGGSSVYQSDPGTAVTLHRPGGGTGAQPWDSLTGEASLFNEQYGNWDPFDDYLADPVKGSPRQTFEHWDAKFISFLEGQGYRVDYCTDMDIHLDDDLRLLSKYSLVLSVGHDEYYTDNMRNNLETYVAAGGNIAFFSGNTCYWHLYFPKNDLLTINRDFEWGNPNNFANGHPTRPENSLTGVSYWNAGERDSVGAPGTNDSINLQRVGYTVQHTDLWPFEDTALNEGDTFGANEGLLGYECDGATFDSTADKPYTPNFSQNTPLSFVILGFADTSVFNEAAGDHYATMGMYSQNGTVFTGATTDWPRVVWEGERHSTLITRNVIDRLGGNPKGLSDIGKIEHTVCCDGFYSDDDEFRHAIIGNSKGAISDLYFNPTLIQGQDNLITQGGLKDLGAFYTPNDQQRRVVTLTNSGDVSEISYNPNTAPQVLKLGSIGKAKRICGFFSDDDNKRHAIVSTAEGGIWQILYDAQGHVPSQIGSIDNVVDIGCFFSSDDNYSHVVVGTNDGSVSELYYRPGIGVNEFIIGNVPGLKKVSAYYRADDKFFSRRVQVLDSKGHLYEFRYSPKAAVIKCLLISATDDYFDIGGFFSSDDDHGHCIVSINSGLVQELYFER